MRRPGWLDRRSRRDFVAWAREHALPLATPLDGMGPLPEWGRYASLLEGRRVVLLGESDHFIHEKVDVRLLVLRWLADHGFRTVLEELSCADGARMARYLADGDEAALEGVTLFGYRGAWRTDRDDRPTGALGRGWEDGRYPTAGMTHEHRRFLAGLRTLGSGDEAIRFAGIDVETVPGVGYELAEEMLGPLAGAPEVDALRTLLVRVPGETVEEEIGRLDAALAACADVAPQDASLREALHHVVAQLREGFLWVRDAHPVPDYEGLADVLAHRELVMCANAKRAIRALPTGEGAVVLSHDLHLAKRDRELPANASGPGGGRTACLGTALTDDYGDAVLGIWLVHGQGADLQPLPDLPRELVPPRGSLNELLAEVGPAFVLPAASDDPRARWLARPQDFAHMYNATTRLVLPRQTDLIVYVRDVTPLHGAPVLGADGPSSPQGG